MGGKSIGEGDLAETSQAFHMKALVAWHCGTTMLIYQNIFDSKEEDMIPAKRRHIKQIIWIEKPLKSTGEGSEPLYDQKADRESPWITRILRVKHEIKEAWEGQAREHPKEV